MRFAGFIGPSYLSQSVNVDCQRTVNLYPEINALGTGKEREVASLVMTPGLRALLTLPESPIRGIYTASNSELYVAAGQKMYQVSSSWVATELGVLDTRSGPVSMADNGTHIVLVDGVAGYTFNMDTDTFAKIVDPDFFVADQVAYVDGYFICNKKGSQQFFISGLNDIEWDALDIASAEGSPDNIIGLIAANQQLVMFGTQSIEVFYNSGDADFPFTRIQGAVIDTGCAAAFSVQKLGTAGIFFVGADDTGTGIVYQMQGYQVKPVSTPSLESLIRSLSAEQISAAVGWTYQQGGHPFYCLNIPGLNSTWCYDASTQFWHERTFLELWSQKRHRAQVHTVAHGLNVVGDYETGVLYALDPAVFTDNGTSIVRERTAPHISKGLKLIRHHSFELDMETGVGLIDGQGSDPQAMLQWSNDGGHTWSAELMAPIGGIGKTKTRVKWNRLGMARDRVYRVRITDPVPVTLIGAEVEVEEGLS